MPSRILGLWCPDWPVVAARRRGDAPDGEPVAVLEHGRVLSVSHEARAEEITAGLRRREAEARCPGIVIVDVDPAADARAFEPVARAVECLTPRLVIDRPGMLAFPTRGPSRYFGGDDGLDVIRALIPAAAAALVPGGWLVMEVGLGQADEVQRLIRDAPGLDLVRLRADLQRILRVVVARRSE